MSERNETAGLAPALTPAGRRTVWLGLSLSLIGFNLRLPIASLGPVLPEAIKRLMLSPFAASLLTALPSLCFGLFSPLAPLLSRMMGSERALALMLGLLTAGTALRLLPSAAALFCGQILACVGIAIVNILAPALVKRDFPKRAAAMTGLFTMALCVGSAAASGLTVPFERLFAASFNQALAVWAVFGALALFLWLALLPPKESALPKRRSPGRLWRDPLAWQVTGFMGLQSALAYLVFGWLVPLLCDRGLSPAAAGGMMALSLLGQAAMALIAPSLAARRRQQSGAALFFSALSLFAFGGCFYAPLRMVGGFALLLGLAQGGLFGVALILIVLRARDPETAGSLSAMAQGVGYLFSALGPFVAGLLQASPFGWNGVAAWVLAIGLVMAASGAAAGRPLFVGERR